MEITRHQNTVSLPLALYEAVPLAEAVSREGEEFVVILGISQEGAEELGELSRDQSDEALQENTSDYQRFGTGSFADWYSKGRTLFTLLHKPTGKVAAVVWLGPKSLGAKSLKYLGGKEEKGDEGEWHTLAYRCYPDFRGQGLMKNFVRFVLDEYQAHFPGAKLWAGMHAKNGASDGLATALGFVKEESLCDQEAEWVVMIKE